MNQINNGNENIEEDGVGTPAMTLDLGHREVVVESLVNETTAEDKDSDPHEKSLPE